MFFHQKDYYLCVINVCDADKKGTSLPLLGEMYPSTLKGVWELIV